MIRIERLAPGDAGGAAAWDAFVLACPEATFFHRSAWQGAIRDTFGHDTHYLLAEVDGRMAGLLPLAQVKTWLFGHSLVSLPFCVYGGVAAHDEEAGRVAAAALEREAIALAQRLGAEHLELRQLQRRHEEWPRQDLYVSFRKAIVADDEANLQAIPRKQRAMVRKAIQRGLGAEADADCGRFFALYADNVHRHGTPAMPRRWFETLRERFGADAEVLTICAPDGEPVSSVLSFIHRNEILPYYAGDAERARELAANDFKYWSLMCRAAARGLTTFDYGRSKRDTGSFAFKKNWGFEPHPLHYEYRLFKRDAVPQHNPSNPKYRLLIDTWRRLPRPLVNRIGPLLVRGLG